jgi:hypothetical protein
MKFISLEAWPKPSPLQDKAIFMDLLKQKCVCLWSGVCENCVSQQRAVVEKSRPNWAAMGVTGV